MKPEKIKAVLFDIDGTLLDSNEMIFRCYEHTFSVHKLPIKTREQIKSQFGKSLEDCYKFHFPNEDIIKLCETHLAFQERNLHLSKPFNSVGETLEKLKNTGIKLVAITVRSKRTSLKTLEFARIAQYFDMIISREDVKNSKPDPEAILKALKFLKLSVDEVIFIGDTDIDIQTGKNADIKTIKILHDHKKIDSDSVIFDIKEVLNLIN